MDAYEYSSSSLDDSRVGRVAYNVKETYASATVSASDMHIDVYQFHMIRPNYWQRPFAFVQKTM